MKSAAVSWNDISKPFFCLRKHLTFNSRSYPKYLRNDLAIATKELYPENNFIFIQDSAPFYCAKIVQNFLQEELKSRFVLYKEWPSSSPERLPLDYSFECKRKSV